MFSNPTDIFPLPADNKMILWGSVNILRKLIVLGLGGLAIVRTLKELN
jgi:hypothetical protein